ncbi:MAG: amidase [Henriciella sp.]|nr:amidase [Henriciella sp.]MBO6693971.1 amidase [Henriciella sp.]
MKHLLASAALGVICMACSSVADVPEPATEMTEAETNLQPDGWIAKSLPEIADGLQSGQVRSVDLVLAYQTRIEQIDQNGPTLQSVLALNPTALDDARDSDERRMLGKGWGPLDGVPILLKDNIESLDPVATTAGALALKDNITGRDSPLVAGLRAQGAIILGKTNLSQWANFRSNESLSGWSALGGQVRNPHMLDRNPCGSSSGSGAAAAASLAAGAVGTETNGSIICPSNVNGVVGFKPTVGVVPQQYIIPISHSQDTAGPMTKTVKGAAMMLTAMAGMDASIDYAAGLDTASLSGKRVGVMRFAQGSNADIHAQFDAALAVLEAQGAELVEIDTFDPDAENFWGEALSVLEYEFRHTLNAYLADTPDNVSTRSLAELIAFNEANADIELALFDQDLLESSEAKGPLTDEAYLNALAAIQAATREKGIDKLLAEHSVDMLVAPSGPVSPRVDPINGDTWPSWAGAGYLAAIAGYPHITVPMGDVHGVPIGFSIMGAKDADAEILSWGYAYEQASQMRVEPQYLANAEARREIAAAMEAK